MGFTEMVGEIFDTISNAFEKHLEARTKVLQIEEVVKKHRKGHIGSWQACEEMQRILNRKEISINEKF